MSTDNTTAAVSYRMLSKADIADPLGVIEDFFSYIALRQAQHYITGMLQAAFSDDYWKECSPGNLLFFCQHLLKLIEGTHVIASRTDEWRKKSSMPASVYRHAADQSILDPLYYCGWHSGSTAWDFFPRHLSKNEFARPYSVFLKFFRYYPLAEWKEELEDILLHALSKSSVFDAGNGSDLLTIHIYLQKLLEAAHLIEVRDIHKRNDRKPVINK